MRNLNDVLAEKQKELARIVKEIEAIHIVLPMISNSPPLPSPPPPAISLDEANAAAIHDVPPSHAKRWP